MDKTIKLILKQIKKSNKIALFSHISPDPDTIGSTMALYYALKNNMNIDKKYIENFTTFESYYKTLDKNSLSLGFFGLPKNSSGGALSKICPSSMKSTRLATSLAKPISCVTIIIVIPSSPS